MKMIRLLSLGLLLPLAMAAKKAPEPPPPPPPVAPPVDPEAWRATPPAPSKESAWAPPAVQVLRLSNGIPIYYVSNPGLPLVSVQLLMDIGRDANPEGKAGLGALTANMLDEGTKARTGAELAEATAMLGANLTVGVTDEGPIVSLDALTGDTLGPSLDLMADMVLAPRFDSGDVERVRTETVDALNAAVSEPREVARRAFLQGIWGANHPYGVPSEGTADSVAALKKKDIKRFYSTWWHAGNAAFVVVGALDASVVQQSLEARFGSWKVGTSTNNTVAAPSAPMKTQVLFVEQPGAVQSVIRVGTPALARSAPEFMAANVAGTLVSGMFSSPLNMNLREDKGWSYGAYGGFTESSDYGMYVARTSVQADKTAPAVTEILKELSAAAKAPPSAEMLQLAKDNLVKSLAGNFETNALTAATVTAIPTFDLPVDALSTYKASVEGVTAQQIEAMSQRYMSSDRLLVVVVGPRTLQVPGENGATQTVDVVSELKALGYAFTEVSAP